MIFRRIFLSFFIGILFFSAVPIPAFAQVGILPTTTVGTAEECKASIEGLAGKSDQERGAMDASELENILGCAIKFGYVKLWMIPFFVTSLLKFLVALGGMVCMLFIVIGGYHYIYGGITDEKEKGKKTVMYAIMGLVVVLISWMVINIIQTQLTK